MSMILYPSHPAWGFRASAKSIHALGRCPRREVRICLTMTVFATRRVATPSSAPPLTSAGASSAFDSTNSYASAGFSAPPFTTNAASSHAPAARP